MSRTPYQRLGGGPGGVSSPQSPREHEKHRQRRVEDQADEQAPWLTHLEYSVDPLLWEDDLKHKACPLCNSAFVASLMGSGRHHCRMCGCLCCGPCSRGALDLPGYESGGERVCEVCRKRVLALRTFLTKNQETLINNVSINRDSVKFLRYAKGDEPYYTEVWLAQSLLLLMYNNKDAQFEGVPIHHIESVETGFSTKELIGRRSKTVMCCMSVEDQEFAAKSACLFSLRLIDGRTLDFEAATPALCQEWSDRLRSLVTHTASFVEYHFDVAQYKVHELTQKERDRLSPSNIKRLIDKEKSAQRASRNVQANKMREKYARKG